MSAISVSNLTKNYGDVRAVDGISFQIDAGEAVALLGPNGAGKTTTVEILEGYRRRDSGVVTVLGLDPANLDRELRRRVGIVLQSSGIDDELTVREALDHFAGYYPQPRKSDELLELAELQGPVRIKHLSGGQRRRLDLAMALIGRPDLLFLDEPTTGFDPAARRDAWDLIGNLKEGGATVLLTTHYLDEAQRLSDRVIVINRGQIVAEGKPDSLGGRDTATARIRFRLPVDVPASSLPVAPTRLTDRLVEISTAQPTSVLNALSSWALARSEELEALEVTRPSLEDTYLQLLGEE